MAWDDAVGARNGMLGVGYWGWDAGGRTLGRVDWNEMLGLNNGVGCWNGILGWDAGVEYWRSSTERVTRSVMCWGCETAAEMRVGMLGL